MSRSILQQSSKIGFFALISRFIAFIREWLLILLLGVGDTSDVFFTAFRIPNTMRKIFAEGALASILVPAFVNAQHKNEQRGMDNLVTTSFIFLATIIFIICVGVFLKAEFIIQSIAPGFSVEKIQRAASLIKILISFILFISSGVIFGSALQAQRKFFIPAITPALLNVTYVESLCLCLYFQWSVVAFSYCMVMTSIISFVIQLAAYLYQGYKLGLPTTQARHDALKILLQLIPCIISVGIMEINHFINTGFASYLPSGSMTLLRNGYQFVNIPVGIITASLVTVLLPHFTKLHLEKSQDLANHMFEAIKFIIWATLPICFMLYLFSGHIFETLLMGNTSALEKISLAQSILIAYLVGLLSFSLNKVFMSIFYALRLTIIPMIASIIAIAINYYLNKEFAQIYGAAGIAFASSIAAISQTIFLSVFLSKYLNLTWSTKQWIVFFLRYSIQLTICSTFLWAFYVIIYYIIQSISFTIPLSYITLTQYSFLKGFGVWFWVGPLCLIYLGLLYFSRKYFKIELSYFDQKQI